MNKVFISAASVLMNQIKFTGIHKEPRNGRVPLPIPKDVFERHGVPTDGYRQGRGSLSETLTVYLDGDHNDRFAEVLEKMADGEPGNPLSDFCEEIMLEIARM